MKIRIKSNSLRYRLTRTDVDTIARDGYLQEQVDFAGTPLLYCLRLTQGQMLTASFIGNKITLSIPQSMIDELINTDKVGFADTDGPLHLLVEKDFTCLDNVDEDQSDNYPNPLLQKQ